jgi:hypothetical protein
MSDEIPLSQALSSLNDADFGKIRTVVSPPGKARGIWMSVYDFLEHVAKKKSPRTALERISASHPEGVQSLLDTFKFPGRGQQDTPIISVRDAVKLLQVTPGDAGNEARTHSSSLMCRYYGGDMSLVPEVTQNAAEQQRLAVEDPTNPMAVFGADLVARGGKFATTVSASAFSKEQGKKQSRQKAPLPEPWLDWQKDLNANRAEIPAAKATLKALFEVEVAAGALPKSPAPNSSAPQARFRALAEAALMSSRNSVQRRLGTLHAPLTKRPRTEEEKTPQDSVVQEDDDLLTVSEVMLAAGVWAPVWKPYMSDLSNRMVQLKCEATDGAFAECRPQEVRAGYVDVHSYKKNQDWPLARQALRETKDLYEKRARELLEDAFLEAGVYSEMPSRTHAGVCAAAARGLAARLDTAAGV